MSRATDLILDVLACVGDEHEELRIGQFIRSAIGSLEELENISDVSLSGKLERKLNEANESSTL